MSKRPADASADEPVKAAAPPDRLRVHLFENEETFFPLLPWDNRKMVRDFLYGPCTFTFSAFSRVQQHDYSPLDMAGDMRVDDAVGILLLHHTKYQPACFDLFRFILGGSLVYPEFPEAFRDKLVYEVCPEGHGNLTVMLHLRGD